jgi:hypothetical protein
MPQLTVRFKDNEVVVGFAETVDLDDPGFHLDVSGAASNNAAALVSLSSVKRINLESGPADEHVETADKMVALRFVDGEVMRGYLNGSLKHHRYGMTMTLYSQDKKSMDVVGVPYASLKALYYLRSWDSRPPGFQKGRQEAPLVQLIGDMHELNRLHGKGTIDDREFNDRRKAIIGRI